MNELKTIIKDRRSVRRFHEKNISHEQINEILSAAQWAQSWGNSQCWEIILIDANTQKEKLTQILRKKNPALKAINSAPIVIALCAHIEKSGYYKKEQITKFKNWFMYDLGILTQNICLTAHSLGLGSVVIGAFDHEKAKEILNIPKQFEIVSLLPIGYPAHLPPAPKRRDKDDFTHYNCFNNPFLHEKR